MSFLPSPSSSSDIFLWQAQATMPSNVVGDPDSIAADDLQITSDQFFVLMGFLGVTNYDSSGGDVIASVGAGPAPARSLITGPFVPNNFSVMIRYNSDIAFMDQPMPQACLSANAYRTGQQLPYPVIFSPMSRFDFEFQNTAPTLLEDVDGDPINLVVNFALLGYFVPVERVAAYLKCYEAYSYAASEMANGWIRKFTAQDMPAGVGL